MDVIGGLVVRVVATVVGLLVRDSALSTDRTNRLVLQDAGLPPFPRHTQYYSQETSTIWQDLRN